MFSQWKSACRALFLRASFSIAAIVILSLGIGSTTTLFSVIDTVLWKSLPYPHADRLVTIYEANPFGNQNTSLVAPARIEDWNRLSVSFDAISGSYSESVTDTSGSEPVRLSGRRVAPRFFTVYGTPALLGRTFAPEEEKSGGPLVAIISHRLWQERYQADPGVIGRRLVFDGKGYTIVGVMPHGFAPASVELWMPAQISAELLRQRDARFYGGVGRMKQGITVGQAQAELSRVQAELGRQFPRTDKGWSVLVGDLKSARVGQHRESLSLIFAAVVLLLVIACVNVGGLMLGQLRRRARELAIRSSLGATRPQLVGLMIREVSLLVAAGAILGVAFSLWGVQLMRSIFINLPRIEELTLDWRALLFTTAAALAAASVFGLAPVLETVRTDYCGSLYQTTRAQSKQNRLLQRGLVAAQFAATVVILLASGLLIRSYSKLSLVDPGFDPSGVITFHVGAEWGEDRRIIGRIQTDLLTELARRPGVLAAGMTNFLPASRATLRYEISLEGYSAQPETNKILVGERTVGGDYFQTLRLPLIQGRSCPELRPVGSGAPAKAVVNRRFVEMYGTGAPLIGRRLGFGKTADTEIVGIVADAREDSLDAPPFPYVYDCLPAGSWPDPEYVVRGSGDPRAILATVRDVVRSIAPKRALFGVESLREYVEASLDTPRLSSEVLALFAGIALVLASVGLYSLVMLAVTAQTKEIGLRVALGALPSRILGSVMLEAAAPVVLGLASGALLAVIALRAPIVRPLLFDVGPSDGLTLLCVAATLAIVSTAAALIPARRAATIDPVRALRED